MGCEDITGGLPGLASHIYFTPEQLIKGNFRELANGIFDVCLYLPKFLFYI